MQPGIASTMGPDELFMAMSWTAVVFDRTPDLPPIPEPPRLPLLGFGTGGSALQMEGAGGFGGSSGAGSDDFRISSLFGSTGGSHTIPQAAAQASVRAQAHHAAGFDADLAAAIAASLDVR
jgi:hypothetical protein